jgi:integrase-like protein
MGIYIQYIQPGKPQQNTYIKRYNRTVRHEWPALGDCKHSPVGQRDQNIFETIEETQSQATELELLAGGALIKKPLHFSNCATGSFHHFAYNKVSILLQLSTCPLQQSSSMNRTRLFIAPRSAV